MPRRFIPSPRGRLVRRGMLVRWLPEEIMPKSVRPVVRPTRPAERLLVPPTQLAVRLPVWPVVRLMREPVDLQRAE